MSQIKSKFSTLVRWVRPLGIAALVVFLGAARPPKSAGRVGRPQPVAVNTVMPRIVHFAPPGNLIHEISSADSPAPAVRRVRVMRMEVTAYCPCKKCCGPNAAGVTASGLPVSHNAGRFVAADTDHLPFGSRLVIPGYDAGPVEVIDRGGAIKGNKLDVYFHSHERALEWGRQWLDVVVVE